MLRFVLVGCLIFSTSASYADGGARSGRYRSVSFVHGFVPGLLRSSGEELSQGRGRSASSSSGGSLVSLRAQQNPDGSTSRRGMISLAVAVGSTLLSGGNAFAANSVGPEGIDGPSQDKMAIKSTAPGLNRNRIKVNANYEGKEVTVPKSAKELAKTYKVTPNGVFYKVLKEGDPDGPSPKEKDTVKFQYVGQVCEVDKDGEYDCATRTGLAEVYPTLPQGIAQDSPQYDSSFDRGRPYEGMIGKAQISFGLEEALADMKPGGQKMVFLVPELSIACPKSRVCVAEINTDERLSFYLELVSVNGVTDSRLKAAPAAPVLEGGGPANPQRPRIQRKRLWGSAPAPTPPPGAAPAAAPADMAAAPAPAPAPAPAAAPPAPIQ